MSSRVSDEIAKLAARSRHQRISDHDTINALNVVVGYAYLLHFHPQRWEELRKHLEAFNALACTRGHLDLRDHSAKIIGMMSGRET
jgi:hypothetical protein